MQAAPIMGIIQSSLAPVVMLTTSAILVGGMLARYAAVNDRLRAMVRERRELLRAPDGALSRELAERDPSCAERLREIDAQVPGLLWRHRLIHNAVLLIYLAMLVFVASMFALAAATITNLAIAAGVAGGVISGWHGDVPLRGAGNWR